MCVWARLSFSSVLETSGGDNCVSALLFRFFGIVGCLSAVFVHVSAGYMLFTSVLCDRYFKDESSLNMSSK